MEKINLSDLQPCDVLLCRGEGKFSDMIVLLDGGTYSHAALYAGKINGKHCVIQATGRGIVCDPIEKLKEAVFVDVFRFNKNGHKLGDANYLSTPILEIGQAYVESHIKYAFDHLIMLALLGITRDIPLKYSWKKQLRIALDHAADFLFKLLDKGIRPMVCTEIVYRCFDEADENKKYQLSISALKLSEFSKKSKEVTKDLSMMENTVDSEIDLELQKSKKRFLEAYSKVKEKENPLMSSNTDMISSCVFPKDFENSKDLIKIGRLNFD